MPIAVLMPTFSPALDKGKLARWLVGEGDEVSAGDLLAEIEVDKTTVELEAEQGGTVGRILVQEGDAPIEGGTALAFLLSRDEDQDALAELDVSAPQTHENAQAAEDAISISRVSDENVRAAYDRGRYELIPHSRMRRTVASRLTEAKSTIPHFYVMMDCRIDAALELRKQINSLASEEDGPPLRISLNDFVIKALGVALMRVPAANASWTGEGILAHKQADIGIAVAVEGGLYTPIVRNVQDLPLSEISRRVRRLTERARRGVLSPDEYRGGSSTVSNLGMYPVRRFTAVINPPQATILAIGQSEKRPIVRRGEIVTATMLSATLSCDHRVVDGAVGAQLLAAFKKLIEDHPDELL
jgi:pyruvate dehydrogenase E2 component (dihydrolipoamide acetyltransferase)